MVESLLVDFEGVGGCLVGGKDVAGRIVGA